MMKVNASTTAQRVNPAANRRNALILSVNPESAQKSPVQKGRYAGKPKAYAT
jgi:hypothetical protein